MLKHASAELEPTTSPADSTDGIGVGHNEFMMYRKLRKF